MSEDGNVSGYWVVLGFVVGAGWTFVMMLAEDKVHLGKCEEHYNVYKCEYIATPTQEDNND